MSFSIVVAMSENRVIGLNNQLPWHLPNDFKHFKEITMGKPIIMGRKTYESIGKVLPGRKNIILSSNLDYTVPGGLVIHNLSEIPESDLEQMIIGGAHLYKQCLDKADTIYLTIVHATLEGDTFFPELSKEWIEVDRQRFEADDKHKFSYSFVTLKKV
jgi:dihydrofolate reductase